MLFWTTIYGDWYSGLTEEGVAELEYRQCSHRCYIANDRRMLNVSDAVVFYGRDTDPEHMPEERAPYQKWVYWSLEPPWHTPVHFLKTLNNTFNWTMTYRLDSDVLNTYATLRKLNSDQRPYSKESLKNVWKRKSKTAVWAVSSCKTSGKREHYIEELQQYLYVDVYGKCGENKCPWENASECRELFAKNYFFYLSFENCICKDYVTEKLYKMLLYNIIPVVYGGANYSDVAPPGSYIDALSFESPMHLARHLNEVARNFTMYEVHFQWKNKYKIEPLYGYDLCNLCRKLYSEDFRKNSVSQKGLSRHGVTEETTGADYTRRRPRLDDDGAGQGINSPRSDSTNLAHLESAG
ncbi:hypothetical protein MTO96_024537 [Rhipicephalus appendiculatus]